MRPLPGDFVEVMLAIGNAHEANARRSLLTGISKVVELDLPVADAVARRPYRGGVPPSSVWVVRWSYPNGEIGETWLHRVAGSRVRLDQRDVDFEFVDFDGIVAVGRITELQFTCTIETAAIIAEIVMGFDYGTELLQDAARTMFVRFYGNAQRAPEKPLNELRRVLARLGYEI